MYIYCRHKPTVFAELIAKWREKRRNSSCIKTNRIPVITKKEINAIRRKHLLSFSDNKSFQVIAKVWGLTVSLEVKFQEFVTSRVLLRREHISVTETRSTAGGVWHRLTVGILANRKVSVPQRVAIRNLPFNIGALIIMSIFKILNFNLLEISTSLFPNYNQLHGAVLFQNDLRYKAS